MAEPCGGESPGSEAKPSRGLLHAIGNGHIDAVWLWTWNEGLEAIRATFRSALDRMDEYPDFRFTSSSAAFYAQLKTIDPSMLEEIRARIREGRWEIVGGWWLQPDVNIPSGESLVRQALCGQRFFLEELGVRASVGYNPDTFGHPGTLPQILSKAGLSAYVFMRPGPHEKDLPGNLFHWVAPDGSKILALRISNAYACWGEGLEEHVRRTHDSRPPYVSDYAVFYGVGNHGGGPTRQNIEWLVGRTGSEPAVRLSTLGQFFASVEDEVRSGADVPCVEDDLLHHARGCYSAHSEVKRENRRAEHLLLSAEKWASVATATLGRPYPVDDLRDAWQSVLYNQFHDILAGTSLSEGYRDARDLYGHAAVLAGKHLHFSLQALSSRIDTRGESDAVVVFNSLPWPVRAPVELEPAGESIATDDGGEIVAQLVQPTTETAGIRRLVFVADLPAMGYRVFRQVPALGICASRAGALTASTGHLENDWLRVEIDESTGWISGISDKRNGAHLLRAPACVPVVLDDRSDTWSHDVRSFRMEAGRFTGVPVCVEEHGPVRACVRVEQQWGSSSIIQRIYLYRELDFIEARFTVNWNEQHRVLKVAFPLAIETTTVRCEVPYGFSVWPHDGEEHPCQQWIDLIGTCPSEAGGDVSCGFALLNDCKFGFDCLESELRLTALRSPVYAHHDPQTLTDDRRYRFMDQGQHEFTLRLLPHDGRSVAARCANELNVPPLYVNEYQHAGPLPPTAGFLEAEPENLLLTVLKRREEGNEVVVRGYECAGVPLKRARIRLPWLEREWEASLEAHEIKTWLVGLEPPYQVREANLLEE